GSSGPSGGVENAEKNGVSGGRSPDDPGRSPDDPGRSPDDPRRGQETPEMPGKTRVADGPDDPDDGSRDFSGPAAGAGARGRWYGEGAEGLDTPFDDPPGS